MQELLIGRKDVPPLLVFLGLRGSAQFVPKFHIALRASITALPELNSI